MNHPFVRIQILEPAVSRKSHHSQTATCHLGTCSVRNSGFLYAIFFLRKTVGHNGRQASRLLAQTGEEPPPNAYAHHARLSPTVMIAFNALGHDAASFMVHVTSMYARTFVVFTPKVPPVVHVKNGPTKS